jgi:lipoprotein-releasing system permease protein
MEKSGRLLAQIAWRFLRSRRTRLLDGAARSALAATAIGVTAMVVAMALMTGYRDALEKKLTQDRIAVMAYPLEEAAFDLKEQHRADILSLPAVEAVRRVGYGQGSLRSVAKPDGADVTLRGVDGAATLEGLGRIERWSRPVGGASDSDQIEIIVGRDLAARLAPARGEVLRLLVLGVHEGRPRFSYRSVTISGTFSSGLSEFDQRLVVLDREVLEQVSAATVGETIFEILVSDARRTKTVAERVREILGPNYLVLDWPELNRELFTALAVQKLALFLLLGLIVVVSTFNVASSLLVLVRERTRDIGVLAAVGLSPRALRRLFLLYGGGLSLGGVAVGVGVGGLASWLLTRYELIRFDPELAAIYFLSSVPLDVRLSDVVAISGFTLVVTLLACWLPARRLGRIQPAAALRSE